MKIRELIQRLKGKLTWKKFHMLTGISCSVLWKMEHLGQSCPPKRLERISLFVQKYSSSPLSQEEIILLLLGEKKANTIADLALLLAGSMSLDAWLKCKKSQRSQVKILGLEYSTIFHRREGKIKRFWPNRAIEIARRSNYEIDLFDLLGVKRR